MADPVSWIFDVQLQPGRDADWRALMGEMIDATRANEPETVGYEWSASADEVNWQIHESFADAEAAMTHSTAFGQHFASRFFKCVKPTRMVVYGVPNDALRAALAGLAPLYMGRVAGFTR